MHPFYFGSGSRRLFGLYEPARHARQRPRAALICYPWGAEFLHAHRSLRQLANLLAEAGVDSLRFDYYATGDSAGDDGESDLSGWRHDIRTATDELASLTGASRVTLIGLRLGATLAAQASVDMAGSVEGLVLWDPVENGGAYIDELHGLCRTQSEALVDPVVRPASEGGGCDILGFPLTERIQSELAALDLSAIAADIQCGVHAVVSGLEADSERLHKVLSPVSSALVQRIESPPIWLEDWPRNSGFVPVKILQQIVSWTAS